MSVSPPFLIMPERAIIIIARFRSNLPGIHVNFKLSGKGERVMLIDTDERGNRVLDYIEFGSQVQDASFGRFPDGTGSFRFQPMTPGRSNDGSKGP